MILPKHKDWINRLIDECRSNPNVSEWWVIGNQMHTITDDYKIFYDYESAKPELDAMWNEWIKADPRGESK